jgi:hypothetical protein
LIGKARLHVFDFAPRPKVWQAKVGHGVLEIGKPGLKNPGFDV